MLNNPLVTASHMNEEELVMLTPEAVPPTAACSEPHRTATWCACSGVRLLTTHNSLRQAAELLMQRQTLCVKKINFMFTLPLKNK